MQVLENQDLKRLAPSIFATAPWHGTSDRYGMINSLEIVDQLRDSGWKPVFAMSSKVRDTSRKGFEKHLIRFRNPGADELAQDCPSEIVMVNSHDRASSLQFHAGAFRMACSNGLVIATRHEGSWCVKHSGDVAEGVNAAMLGVVRALDEASVKARQMSERILEPDEEVDFMNKAIRIRWDEENAPRVPTSMFSRVRREQDAGSDLWCVYNRAQESLIKGGVRLRPKPGARRKVLQARETRAVDAVVTYNRKLWELAQDFLPA